MFTPSPFLPILVCHEPVNFRLGIDGLIAHARNVLEREPMDGAIFVFRNKIGNAVRMLFYVEDGWWRPRSHGRQLLAMYQSNHDAF